MSKKNVLTGAKKRQALAHAQAGRIEEALDLYQKVCKVDPQDAESWFMVGTLYGRLGSNAEAETALRRTVGLQPNAASYLNLAQSLELQGKLSEAEDSYLHALSLNGDLADAHDALGRISQQRGDIAAAIAYHQKALKLNPSRIPTYLALVKAYILVAELDGAAKNIEKVLQLDASNAAAYFELARVRMYQGAYQDALQTVGIVLQLQPDNVEAKLLEANIRVHLHDYQGALNCVNPLLDRYLEFPGVALVYAGLAHLTKDNDGAITRLETLLKQEGLPDVRRSQVNFNLGHLYDRSGDYDQAFKHYQAGNELMPAKFESGEWEAQITTKINTFNREALKRAPRATNDSEQHIFIVGMPRSGTTLVEQILAMYPEVAAAGELPDIENLAHEFDNLLKHTVPPHDIGQLSSAQCDVLAQRYIDALASRYPTAQLITDKMPNNFLHLGLIALLFPKARVIHCVRDPLDTCLSCYFQMFPSSHGYANDLAKLGRYYRQYQRLMEHWRQVLDISVFELRYEDLVREPEKSSRAMVEFCGLTWDIRCLEFHKSERSVATASSQQVRRPIYSSSLARWQHYAKHLEPLKQALAGTAL